MIRKYLQRIPLDQEITAAVFIVIIACMGFLSWYGYTRISSLSADVARLNTELASSTALLQTNLNEATTSLANALQEEQQNVREQLGGVQDQVGDVAGIVTDLTKLSKIDPELLAKYSKVFFLSDTYAPLRLATIPPEHTYNEKNQLQIIPEVLPRLEKLMDKAKAAGITLYVNSAYRSFNTQSALKGQYAVTYGAGTANAFSADQGYSEHQLGTTVDFITTGTGGLLEGFDRTPAYSWLEKNAYRYGFVLSYPKNNGYYIFEPWHWRFVGVELATDLHNSNAYFYLLDQRDIDAYLISIFD